MSGIAAVLARMGHQVSGSDLKDSPALARLRLLGVDARVGHRAEHLPAGVDVVVCSTAIPPTNPEVAAAVARGVPVLRRADALRALVATRRSVAVAGSHGKTTTSSMLALMPARRGMAPQLPHRRRPARGRLQRGLRRRRVARRRGRRERRHVPRARPRRGDRHQRRRRPPRPLRHLRRARRRVRAVPRRGHRATRRRRRRPRLGRGSPRRAPASGPSAGRRPTTASTTTRAGARAAASGCTAATRPSVSSSSPSPVGTTR